MLDVAAASVSQNFQVKAILGRSTKTKSHKPGVVARAKSSIIMLTEIRLGSVAGRALLRKTGFENDSYGMTRS
jgi:hypothetical protein